MKSMTAFGRASATVDGMEFTVEMRSVNNRYVDWNIRSPKIYSGLEDRIKSTILAAGVSRGKIDLTLSCAHVSDSEFDGILCQADITCAKSYLDAAKILSDTLGIKNDLTASNLLRLPGVMIPVSDDEGTVGEDDDMRWARIAPIITEAAKQFVQARKREGERITEDMTQKLSGIRKLTAEISVRSEKNISSYHEKFKERLKAVISDSGVAIEPSRVLTECAIYADKAAIDEELVRLASHFDALDSLLASTEPVGRRIDFLLQEINREVNTIGSKCVDAEIAHIVVQIKNELEKIREQIQNIE